MPPRSTAVPTLPEEVADHVDHFAGVHVDQHRVVPIADPRRPGRWIGQLVHRGIDPILLAEIRRRQLVPDVELLIAIVERIVIDADVEDRAVAIAIAPPVVAPVVAPVAIPVGSRTAALVPPLPRLRPALALVVLALVILALVVLALVPLTLPLLSLLVLGASSLPLASLAVAPGSVELPLLPLLLLAHIGLPAIPTAVALPLWLRLRLLHYGLRTAGEIATLPLVTGRFELRLSLRHRLLLL